MHSVPNTVSPINIGNVQLKTNLVLAPMSGITNSCFRQLIKELNADAVGLMVTEFISIEALTRKNAQSLRMMSFTPEEEPISIQIFGHDLVRMADAAKMAEEAGAAILDINCGCPVPKVVRRGGGCELMRQTEHLKKILETVVAAVSIPVTLKIRSGWDENSKNAVEVAKMAEETGISMLTIHGRTRTQLYRGLSDWEIISEVARSVQIPVIGSGDIVDYESALSGLQRGVAGVMIGRQALVNPWIFSEIHAQSTGSRLISRDDREVIVVLRRYLELLIKELPAKAVMGRFKQLASQMTRRVRGSAAVRRMLCSLRTLEEVNEVLSQWDEYLCTGKWEKAKISLPMLSGLDFDDRSVQY